MFYLTIIPRHIKFKKDNKAGVKLIVGLISQSENMFDNVRYLLQKKYGNIDMKSGVMDFDHTNYYEKEFGSNLKKIFFSFRNLLRTKDMFKIKIHTIKIEKRLTIQGKRQVNIDPGYVTMDKLVLFTTKNYGHRVYLNNGIYAEITLKFESNTFIPWPWTYQDYKTKGYIDFFNKVRNIYKRQLAS